MAFRVTIYGPDVPLTLEAEDLSFVNDESYGPPKNFGITGDAEDSILVNLTQATAVKVEVLD